MDLIRQIENEQITKERRPDLFKEYIESERKFTKKERKIIEKILNENNETTK